MTREEFFNRMGWRVWFTIAMIVNSAAMIPQIWELIKRQNSAGVSPAMVGIYLGTQTFSMLEGVRVRSRILFWGMLVSMLVSIVTLVLIYKYRA